ncbi:DNA-3-methyladenine glycosylase I [Parvicella tangerina]|uniref:DNA-3-methyladenine glycosylase I n=1 Tax=Parvicella tangerina TaxID=2829795 RepID=A0A916JKN5_9FLAO|nr:DNA-3-methyladenine glycosylase I [Parvicella tangerina]CAG5078534.1 DNA-3-methyladenine glycosylase 1 [Parvicella tangerina]
MARCEWCGDDPLYVKYHDDEWGVPVKDDQKMFEFLILETFQAGLSWITILRKRENFREAFDHFHYQKIAKYDDQKFEELINNSGIIRNRLKIKAAITNAQAFMQVQEEFGTFCKYIWSFVDHTPIQNSFQSMKELPAKTPLAEKISKDLKKRGFKFVGPTVIYAHMQATGMVNDHIITCEQYDKLKNA